MKTQSLLRTFATLVAISAVSELQAQQLTGLEIMQEVEEMLRSTNDSSFTRMKLSSCRFGVSANRITCAEKPRVKVLESVAMNLGIDAKDTKSISITLEPASERGIGMLNYNYDQVGREDQTWLYLSELGRVKRIATGDSDEYAEPASVFGSEFTTEDINYGKLQEYEINIIGEAIENNREVWKIESIPVTDRAKRSRYARSVYYVDRERFVSLRSEIYDKYGKEIKRTMASRVELVNGFWISRSLTMLNLVSNRLSNMAMIDIYIGLDIEEDFLTQRSLIDSAYREKVLARLRAQLE